MDHGSSPKLLHHALSPPPTSYQGYSTWVVDVIALCLSPDPSHRPSSEALLQGANTRLRELARWSNECQPQQQQQQLQAQQQDYL